MFLLSLAIRTIVAAFIVHPGYMDSAYYASGALRLAQGAGFSEPFIWNYLGDPATIPHPGFLYWMPLPSILAAVPALVFPDSFFALQLPFVVLSALLPLVAYGLARQFTPHLASPGGRGISPPLASPRGGELVNQGRRLAWGAGLLVVFSGFFFPYWTLPETFALFALIGSLALWLAGRPAAEREGGKIYAGRWLLVGLLTGLAHLTRADGILLLPIVVLAPLASRRPRGVPSPKAPAPRVAFRVSRLAIRRALLVILGYLLALTPWFARNLVVIGTPLSPSGTRTIWLTNYDDLFCYDCDLSLSSYLAWGWGNILGAKLSALWINFQRFLAEDCLVFLLPFAAMGICRLRRHLAVALATMYLLLIYLAHSLVFTFPGWRGGFFHASGAVLPFLYVAALEGLDGAVLWVARRRRTWTYQQARMAFGVAAIVMAIALSGYMAWKKLPAWRRADVTYRSIDTWLTSEGISHATVMTGDPPAFWYHTRRPAVVVPNADVRTLLTVCDRYGVEYVVLEENHPAELEGLYEERVTLERLNPAATFGEGSVKMWRVE
jgi:hypothetical protein